MLKGTNFPLILAEILTRNSFVQVVRNKISVHSSCRCLQAFLPASPPCARALAGCRRTRRPHLQTYPSMGNNGSKRNDPHASLYEKFNDPELTRLDLRSKNLDEIPEAITVLQKLTWLNLPNNHLAHLPDHLFHLPALKTLRLLCNSISVLPEAVSLLTNLVSLDLSKNDFAELTPSFGTLTALTDLNLHWNLIDTVFPPPLCLRSS